MTAPERIWCDIDLETASGAMIGRVFSNDLGDIPYIRADLVEAMVAEAVAKERLIGLNVEAAKEDGRTIARLMSELAEARAEADRLREAVAKERRATIARVVRALRKRKAVYRAKAKAATERSLCAESPETQQAIEEKWSRMEHTAEAHDWAIAAAIRAGKGE